MESTLTAMDVKSVSGFLGAAALAGIVYYLSLIVYRLYFHPLSKFPGPKLAAMTYLYEKYYDLVKAPGGQYCFHLEHLHQIYGPIIRINPSELHIRDPEYFNTVYAGGSARRHRWERANTANGSPGSMASTGPHDLHRIRRNALNSYFSKASVLRLEERIQSHVGMLCQRLREFKGRGEIFRFDTALTALTFDIITDYGTFHSSLAAHYERHH